MIAACLAVLYGAQSTGTAQQPVPESREQEPAPPEPQEKQKQEPQEKEKEEEKGKGKEEPPPPEKPVDETNAAAEALRKLLGPKTKEVTEPPPLTPAPQPQEAAPQEPTKPPVPPPSPREPVDETKAAEEALKALLPGAKPVEQRPEHVVPEARAGQGAPVQLGAVEPRAPDRAFPLHGSFDLRYRGRWEEQRRDHDNDLLGVLALDVGDPDRDPVSAHFLGRSQWDLDGIQQRNAFNGITETYDDVLTGWIYDAYVDVNAVEALNVLRIGRQTIYETPVLAFFDGLRVETDAIGPAGAWIGGYVGVPVHLFESSAAGDFMIGATGGIAPWRGGRLRLDYMHVQDEAAQQTHYNDLIGVAAWQSLGETTELYGSYTWLEGDSRDARLRVSSTIVPWDLVVQLAYYELLSTQFDLAIEFDPYSASAFAYDPYRQLGAMVSKGFGDHFVLTGGLDIRRLSDSADEGQFNREYERYYLTAGFLDIADTLALDVTGEWWDSGAESFAAVDATLGVQLSSQLSGRLGTGYWLYKFDELTRTERTHVRTWFAGLQYRFGEALRVGVDYTFEDDEFDRYHVLDATLTWYF